MASDVKLLTSSIMSVIVIMVILVGAVPITVVITVPVSIIVTVVTSAVSISPVGENPDYRPDNYNSPKDAHFSCSP
jgi:hypothetical protein